MALLKPDKGKQLVFAKNTKYEGEDYKIGQSIPDIDKLSNHFIDKMYRAGIFAHPDDRRLFKYNEYVSKTEEVQKEPVKEEEDSNPNVAKVVVDTEESFQVEYQGKVREIKRNQLRDDGTLTSGGLKAFKD